MDRVRTRFRNLSLQKSLVLYVIFFALLALLLCQGTAVACDLAEDAIYEAYPSLWERYYLTTEKGERLGEGSLIAKGPWPLTERDERLVSLLAGLPSAAAPVYSALCILGGAFLFYRNRLREPLRELKNASYFKTWLTRILINHCKNLMRQQKRCIVSDEAAKTSETVPDDDREFYALVGELPEDYRMIFLLYYGEGFHTNEIAQIMELNENTVKSRLKRGREKLRQVLCY